MVQIIPRTQQSFGERIGAGLQKGFDLGSHFGQMAVQNRMEQKGKEKEYAKKLKGLEDLKQTPFWENASDAERAIIEAEAKGNISAQTARGLINLHREKETGDFLSRLQTGEPDAKPPQVGAEPISFGAEEPPEEKPIKRVQRSDDFGSKINYWRDVASQAKSKDVRDVANKNAEFYQKQQESEYKKFTEERKFHTDKAEPYLKDILKIEENQPLLDASRMNMERAVKSGNVEGVLPYLASALHLEPLFNQDLASFMTSSKNHFLNSLRKAGSRPNQWIEQQISSAYAKPGRSQEANLSSLALIGFEDDVNRERARIARELEDKDEIKYGFAQKDIGKRTEAQIKEYANKRQDLLSYELRSIAEMNMTEAEMGKIDEVPQGTPLTPKMAEFLVRKYGSAQKAEREAKRMGFEILPDEFYEGL